MQVALLEALQALAKREAVRRHVQRKTSQYYAEQLAEVGGGSLDSCPSCWLRELLPRAERTDSGQPGR